jgi:hypothetical protein
MFITVTVCPLVYPWHTHSHCISTTSTVTLSSYLRMWHPCGIFPSCTPNKILFAHFWSLSRVLHASPVSWYLILISALTIYDNYKLRNPPLRSFLQLSGVQGKDFWLQTLWTRQRKYWSHRRQEKMSWADGLLPSSGVCFVLFVNSFYSTD